jgi:hypothetical protein
MKEIARREGVDDSHASRKVNLTTLALDLVAAILDETLPPEVTLSSWRRGRRCCGMSSGGGFFRRRQGPMAGFWPVVYSDEGSNK